MILVLFTIVACHLVASQCFTSDGPLTASRKNTDSLRRFSAEPTVKRNTLRPTDNLASLSDDDLSVLLNMLINLEERNAQRDTIDANLQPQPPHAGRPQRLLPKSRFGGKASKFFLKPPVYQQQAVRV